jgi:hypothetical protein
MIEALEFFHTSRQHFFGDLGSTSLCYQVDVQILGHHNSLHTVYIYEPTSMVFV